MRYIDSSIFINSALPKDGRDRYKKMIEKIISGNEKFATSVLTIDEVIYIIRKEIDIDSSIRMGNDIINMKNLILLNVDQETILLSLNIIERYKLYPRDAIHAACCIQNNIKVIISDDEDFDKIKEIKRERL